MAGTYLPVAAFLLATAVVAILAATSAVPVAAAAAHKYNGRMVIIRAPGARVLDVDDSTGGALNRWQQRRRLVEDEVAPELGGLLGAGDGPGISYGAFDPNRPVCLHGCAQPGQHYTRPCAASHYCPNTGPPRHARAVHV